MGLAMEQQQVGEQGDGHDAAENHPKVNGRRWHVDLVSVTLPKQYTGFEKA
jgi:hypothetical protein